ncbi:MAG: sulfotransferase [Thermodesulfobacteriota bacterium]|nr:sulfotransferase [Thermodesulfobacteriota bacterium]
MQRKLPNFLIVGAAKSGTSSLYQYLQQHPEVYVPPTRKEPMFFVSAIYKKLSRNDPRHEIADRIVICSLDDYRNLFECVRNEQKAIGEASAVYLYHHETAIPNIKSHLGDIKVIIILRNPIDRAYSSYYHLVRDGAETCSFEDFLEKEEERKRENWDILNYPKSLGFYYDQVKAYMDNFSEVKVCLFDDMQRNSLKIVKDVYVFLGIDESFVPDTSSIYNSSGVPRNKLLYCLLSTDNFVKRVSKPLLRAIISPEKASKLCKILRKKNIGKKAMDGKTRQFLKTLYREDILKLQSLIHRDLSHWLQ